MTIVQKKTSVLQKMCVAVLMTTTALTAVPAMAAESASELERKLRALQTQLDSLQGVKDELRLVQQQLDAMKAAEAATKDAVAKEQATREAADMKARQRALDAGATVVMENGVAEIVPPPAPDGGVMNKNIKITFGGFIEAAAIYRSKNQSADVGSSFNGGIPFGNSPNAHVGEFRGTARQSRLSILAQGNFDKNTALAAYYEMDFLGGAPTANSNQTNSYNPRIRNIYATLDRNDLGFHMLAGQNWSLLTLNRTGIIPRNEVAPAGIEAQYVVGFNFTRSPQIRLVKDWDKEFWFAISAESPQAQVAQSTVPTGTIVNNPGTGQLGTGGTFTLDVAPDMIAKFAMDPGWGHYELFGVSRWFRSEVNYASMTTNGLGVGGSALLPVLPKTLDFQASFMYGKGMGRYGAGQLADVTTDNTGRLVTLPYVSALLGLVAHPTADIDLYAYAGTEQLEKRYVSVGGVNYGYGNPAGTNNTGCMVNGGTCNGNTAREYELTGGFWYKFYQGKMGMMEFGVQDEWVKRYIFAANSAAGGPSTDANIAMFSLRYYPF